MIRCKLPSERRYRLFIMNHTHTISTTQAVLQLAESAATSFESYGCYKMVIIYAFILRN